MPPRPAPMAPARNAKQPISATSPKRLTQSARRRPRHANSLVKCRLVATSPRRVRRASSEDAKRGSRATKMLASLIASSYATSARWRPTLLNSRLAAARHSRPEEG